MKKLRIAMLFVVIMLIFTGCWDSVEVNQYAFVIGMGIDAGILPDEIIVTYQIASPKSEGEDGDAFRNVTISALSLSNAEQQMRTMLDKKINLEHMQVLIIGSQVAQRDVAQFKDYFFRDIGKRRIGGFVVADGRASDVLSKDLEGAKAPSFYIMELLRNNAHESSSIVEGFTPAEINKNMQLRQDYVLPYLTIEPNVAINRAALVRGQAMVGVLDARQVEAYKWLNGGSKSVEATVGVDSAAGRIIFNVGNIKVKTEIEKKGDERALKVKITGRCEVSEVVSGNAAKISDTLLAGAVAQVNDKIKLQSEQFLNYIQGEAQADILDYATLLKNFDAQWWQQSGGRWREIYPNMQISVETRISGGVY